MDYDYDTITIVLRYITQIMILRRIDAMPMPMPMTAVERSRQSKVELGREGKRREAPFAFTEPVNVMGMNHDL